MAAPAELVNEPLGVVTMLTLCAIAEPIHSVAKMTARPSDFMVASSYRNDGVRAQV